MIRKRKKTASIRTIDQLRVLASPVSIEIIHALRGGGPATVAELGPRLGREASSLHYHIRKLTCVGFVHETGTRRSGARTEAIHDVVADGFCGPSVPKNPKRRKLANDAVASLLRLATRNFAQASERPDALSEDGPCRNILAGRYKAWLTLRQLTEVNRHLDALLQIFLANNAAPRGQLCVLTMVLSPAQHETP